MPILTDEQVKQCESFLRSCDSVHEARSGMKDACGMAFNTWRRKIREAGKSGAYAHFFGTVGQSDVPKERSGKYREISWWDIVASPDICPLDELNAETVKCYADMMHQGTEMPPGRVFWDGDRYWLSRGFHWAEAIRQGSTRKTLLLEVCEGTRDDAIRDAMSDGNGHRL